MADKEWLKRRKLIVLSPEDCTKALALVEGRNRKESRLGAMTYGGVRGGAEAHLIGMFGEMAVAKFFGLPVDERIFDHHGDDGIDLENGSRKYGVKCTTYLDEPYMRVEKKHFNRQLNGYILCAMNKATPAEVYLIGWATVDMIGTASQRRFVAKGPVNYVLREEQLIDIDTLSV